MHQSFPTHHHTAAMSAIPDQLTTSIFIANLHCGRCVPSTRPSLEGSQRLILHPAAFVLFRRHFKLSSPHPMPFMYPFFPNVYPFTTLPSCRLSLSGRQFKTLASTLRTLEEPVNCDHRTSLISPRERPRFMWNSANSVNTSLKARWSLQSNP